MADQDILIEYDQMRFTFQHSPPCGLYTSSIFDVAVHESH